MKFKIFVDIQNKIEKFQGHTHFFMPSVLDKNSVMCWWGGLSVRFQRSGTWNQPSSEISSQMQEEPG